jgi:hypothetical protein
MARAAENTGSSGHGPADTGRVVQSANPSTRVSEPDGASAVPVGIRSISERRIRLSPPTAREVTLRERLECASAKQAWLDGPTMIAPNLRMQPDHLYPSRLFSPTGTAPATILGERAASCRDGVVGGPPPGSKDTPIEK